MTKVNASVDNESFRELINSVAESGERIVIEQQGKATAAIITYDDLKRFEALEAILLEKAELEEYELLKAAMRNPAFDFLRDEEDIYTLVDGKPFHDPEYARSVVSEPDFCSITDILHHSQQDLKNRVSQPKIKGLTISHSQETRFFTQVQDVR